MAEVFICDHCNLVLLRPLVLVDGIQNKLDQLCFAIGL